MSAYKLRRLVVVISLHVSVCLVRPGTHIKYINVSVKLEWSSGDGAVESGHFESFSWQAPLCSLHLQF